MDDYLYFDTRNIKGQKYINFFRYKKEKSHKFSIILKKEISEEKKIKNDKDDQLNYSKDKLEQLTRCSWYRFNHHHHCEMCHPKKRKVNKIGKEKTIFRKKEYKNMNFDFSLN